MSNFSFRGVSRSLFKQWISYYKTCDGQYFYLGRYRHAYANAKSGTSPVIRNY